VKSKRLGGDGTGHVLVFDKGDEVVEQLLAFAKQEQVTAASFSGIGAFSDEDLKRVFREGRNRAGRPLWVMPWSVTQNLTDEDMDSLIAALREIPPNPNLVPAPELREQPPSGAQ